jgi:hypothetical protein
VEETESAMGGGIGERGWSCAGVESEAVCPWIDKGREG